VARGRNMCPLPLRGGEVGNAAFDGLVASRTAPEVPRGAVVVMVSMGDIVVFGCKRASVVLKELWEICDPTVVQLHPEEVFEICVRALVKDFAETFLLPNSTKTEFIMVIRGRIRTYKREGLFLIGVMRMVLKVIALCDVVVNENDFQKIIEED
jgi:hypothetical protein